MFTQSQDERRRYYRLYYPPTHRPSLRVWDSRYPVLEISEVAIVVDVKDCWDFTPAQQLDGTLQFPDGGSLRLVGQVKRLERERMLVMLDVFIPTGRIYKEQAGLQKLLP